MSFNRRVDPEDAAILIATSVLLAVILSVAGAITWWWPAAVTKETHAAPACAYPDVDGLLERMRAGVKMTECDARVVEDLRSESRARLDAYGRAHVEATRAEDRRREIDYLRDELRLCKEGDR